jgi:hypothetical protein
MNIYEELFDKFDYKNEYTLIPATGEEIEQFTYHCSIYAIPEVIKDELVEYFKVNNNFFNYFSCDDILIFEWYADSECLWLGQRDFWSFRCLINEHKYTIGDASNNSFGEEYEFNTIAEMLVAFFTN